MERDPRITILIPLFAPGRDKRFRVPIGTSDQDRWVCQASNGSPVIALYCCTSLITEYYLVLSCTSYDLNTCMHYLNT
jgi:hypothetical protein